MSASEASSRHFGALEIISIYKVSQKKWDLLLVIVAVNPTFLGHLVSFSKIAGFYINDIGGKHLIEK